MIKNYKFSELEKLWIKKASAKQCTIVLPESEFCGRIVEAGSILTELKIAKVIFLAKTKTFADQFKNNEDIKVINIIESELKGVLSSALFVKRKEKGLTKEEADKIILDPIYFGTMMVELGLADGLVSGAELTTSDTFRPALQIIKAVGGKKVSSFAILLRQKEIYFLADCGLNIQPSAEEIVDIAIDTANSYRNLLDKEPRVALLSYSTHKSAGGDSALKMAKATELLKERKVDFLFDGEIQVDSALNPKVAKTKCKNSPIEGNANILIFPDLASGNIGYKLMQKFGDFKAIGPIAQGLNKPVNDVSRGATPLEIAMACVITILQF